MRKPSRPSLPLAASLGAAIGLFLGCGTTTPQKPPAMTPEATVTPAATGAWIDLFDGRTLTGWRQLGGAALYAVEDGAIVGTSVPKTPNSFLVTEKEYGDFELELEFKADPEMNSGVQFRSESRPDFKNGRVHGYQYEIDVSPTKDRYWVAGVYDEARRGWLFPRRDENDPVAKAAAAAFTDAGRRLVRPNQWNQARIVAQGDRIRTYLNGELRADLTDGTTPRGFIALQVHGVGDRTEPLRVSWRGLRVKALPAPAAQAR
jgi:hypothetical protein